jgi:hypothetical protein
MPKLMLNGREIVKGDWLNHPFEHGSVISIDHVNKEVHVYDGKEGWTLSEKFGNLGELTFVTE